MSVGKRGVFQIATGARAGVADSRSTISTIEPGTTPTQAQATTLVTQTPPEPLAHSLARQTPIDRDLARLIDAWPSLPPTVKRMILAALEATEPRK